MTLSVCVCWHVMMWIWWPLVWPTAQSIYLERLLSSLLNTWTNLHDAGKHLLPWLCAKELLRDAIMQIPDSSCDTACISVVYSESVICVFVCYDRYLWRKWHNTWTDLIRCHSIMRSIDFIYFQFFIFIFYFVKLIFIRS